jgi:hypothetical protein
MKADDARLIAAVALVLALGVAVAWYNQTAQDADLAEHPVVDRKVIDRRIGEGVLSDHEARFYRKAGGDGDAGTSP